MQNIISTKLYNVILHYHPSLNVIICDECKCSITLKSLKKHFYQYHNVKISSQDIKNLSFSNNNICSHQLSNIQLIDNLNIIEGFECELCSYICKHKKMFTSHLKNSHNLNSLDRKKYYKKIRFQKFYSGNNLCKIKVSDLHEKLNCNISNYNGSNNVTNSA